MICGTEWIMALLGVTQTKPINMSWIWYSISTSLMVGISSKPIWGHIKGTFSMWQNKDPFLDCEGAYVYVYLPYPTLKPETHPMNKFPINDALFISLFLFLSLGPSSSAWGDFPRGSLSLIQMSKVGSTSHIFLSIPPTPLSRSSFFIRKSLYPRLDLSRFLVGERKIYIYINAFFARLDSQCKHLKADQCGHVP